MPSPLLTNRELDTQFARDGFVVLDLLPPESLNRLRTTFAPLADHYRGGFSATLLSPDVEHRQAVHEALSEVMNPLINSACQDCRAVYWGFVSKQPSARGARSSAT